MCIGTSNNTQKNGLIFCYSAFDCTTQNNTWKLSFDLVTVVFVWIGYSHKCHSNSTKFLEYLCGFLFQWNHQNFKVLSTCACTNIHTIPIQNSKFDSINSFPYIYNTVACLFFLQASALSASFLNTQCKYLDCA